MAMRVDFALVMMILVMGLVVKDSHCSIEPRKKLKEFREKVQESATTRSSNTSLGIKNLGRVYYPIGYGADPTGVAESFGPLMAAINDALGVAVQNGLELLPGVKDLGGVVIDLQGGNYIISQPLRFPPGVGNAVIQGGTIRASDAFPTDRHLIELWAPNSRKFQKSSSINPNIFAVIKSESVGMYYEDITFRDVLFDSTLHGGGLYIVDSVRIRVDHCFFIHFSSEGILVERGHETFISSSFLGQVLTIGSDKGEKSFTGTAIDLASNDNAVSDVAIFSAATGVILRGQANILTGVHCYNKATYWGGVGILIKLAGLSQTRIDNCYMDYNAIVMEDPVQVHVSNAFFLGNAGIVLKSVHGRISGLNIINNMFSGDPGNPIVKLDGQFTSIDQTVVDRNNANGGMVLKSTVGKLTVPGNGTKWVADFSNVLLFPNKIDHLQYSFYVRGQSGMFPRHAVTNVIDNVVTVESNKAVNAVVSVAVDQYNLAGEVNALM